MVCVWYSDDGFVWCGDVCSVEVCVVWRRVWCTCGAVMMDLCGVEVCVVWRCVWCGGVCGVRVVQVMMDLCGVCRRQAFHKVLHCVSVANERHMYTNNK